MEGNACLLHQNYLKKSKQSVDEVGDWQQHQCLSDYVEATTAKPEEENVSLTKLYAYGLKQVPEQEESF